MLAVTSGVLIICLIAYEYVTKCRVVPKSSSDIFDLQIEKSYFEHLSILEQKIWIAEEVYRRKTFQIKLLTDEQFKKLKNAKCSRVSDLAETYSYNLLSCNSQQARLNYQPPRLRYFYECEDYVTSALFSAFTAKAKTNI